MADGRAAMLRISSLVGDRGLFEQEGYRRLWLSRLLSSTAANAIVYTMLLLVVGASDNSFSSSLFVVAYIAPSALLGTISGAMIDRAPQGIVLAVASGTRAALCVALAMFADSVAVIYVIAVLFAVCAQFSGPAEAAALPRVVPTAELTSANSLNNLGGLVAQAVGLMVLPAVFIKTVGPEPLAIACAVLLGLAAFNFLLVEGLHAPVHAADVSIRDARERFAEAWHRLTLDSVSYVAVVMTVLANTTGLVVVTLLPRYATQVLDISSENLIFVATPAAAGIWLALRFVRQMSASVSPWWSLGASFAALLVGVALLAFVRPCAGLIDGVLGQQGSRIIISMTIASALAFAFTFVNVVGRTIVNERVPREMQGRIFAAQSVLTNLASIPPILLTGLLADWIGVPPVFFIVALCCGLAAAFYAARNLAMPSREAYA
jgi:MFS family permease